MLSGELYQIQEISGPAVMVERLHELGFFRGVPLALKGRGPFSGPFIVQLKTVAICLREEEWNCLKLKKTDRSAASGARLVPVSLNSPPSRNSEK